MKDTAIGAKGKDNITQNVDTVKVRLMGTEKDIKEYSEKLEQITSRDVEWSIESKSGIYSNKDTNRYKRMYIDVKKNNLEEK